MQVLVVDLYILLALHRSDRSGEAEVIYTKNVVNAKIKAGLAK